MQTLGNVAAAGVVLCWIFSFTVLPALVLLLPFKHKASASEVAHPIMAKSANFVIDNKLGILLLSGAFAVLMIFLSMQNILNDRFSELIEKPHQFRTDNEKVDKHLPQC